MTDLKQEHGGKFPTGAAIKLIISLVLLTGVLLCAPTLRVTCGAGIVAFGTGLFITFAVGHWSVHVFVYGIRDGYMKITPPDPTVGTKRFPPWLTGFLERLVFFGVAFYALHTTDTKTTQLPAFLTFCVAWAALRLAINWGARLARAINEDEHESASGGAQIMLWAIVLSAFLALVGAAVATQTWPI